MASAAWYSQALVGQYSATAARRVNWVADTIKVSLHTSAYTPDQDVDDFKNDATNEVTTGGVTAQTLGTKSVVYDSATNHVQLRAATTTFSSITATFRYIVVWKDDLVSTASSPLLGYVDTLGQSVSATNYVVTWDATEGVLSFVVS